MTLAEEVRQAKRELREERERLAAAQAAAEERERATYATFGERYYADPVGFGRDCLDWGEDAGLTGYQERFLAAVPTARRVSLRSCRGAGKSSALSALITWFALTRDARGRDWKIPITASVSYQLTLYLWPEVKKTLRRVRWDLVGRPTLSEKTELFTNSMRLRFGSAFCVTPDRPERIEGAHAAELLFVFDESKAVPTSTFDAAEGSLGGGRRGNRQTYAVAASTAGAPIGRFYDIQSRKPGYEDWVAQHVSIEEVVREGMRSAEWVEQRRRQWGEHSPLFRQQVLGEFAADEEGAIIPLSWVEAAIHRAELRRERDYLAGLPLAA